MNEINGKVADNDANGYGQSTGTMPVLTVADKNNKMRSFIINNQKIALPLHLQRLVSSLDMSSFMSFAHSTLSQPLTSSESEGSDIDWDGLHAGDRFSNGIKSSKQERLNDKMYVYNFTDVGPERKWLQDILLSDSETETDISDEDIYVKKMLKDRIKDRKRREKYYKKANNSQYGYFGAGLLSINDQFPEHHRSIVGTRKRRKNHEKKEKSNINKMKSKNLDKSFKEPGEIDPADLDNIESGESRYRHESGLSSKKSHSESGGLSRGRKKKLGNLKIKPENMKVKRKKVWQIMAKKELGKIQRAKANNHKEILQGAKRMASMCMKVSRQKAMQSQKIMKETVWRAKRLTREMLGYWKRYDRVERETRRRMEKEAEEQRKMDVELIEVKRQQRKLNFLITQTELYAHFMSKKLGKGTEEEQLRIQ